MKIGVVGLGRMGGNISRRLMKHGHECVVFDENASTTAALAGEGALGATSLQDLVAQLPQPRVIWVMLPAGAPTEVTLTMLADMLQPGDMLIDGGNTMYKDDVRRAREFAKKGVGYLDIGTSGGVWGLERGYCLMVGGAPELFKHIEPILVALAPGRGTIAATQGRQTPEGAGRNPTAELGYLHCGPAGAGHFVKMIHNGIEYGMMQAYAEGFDILKGRNNADLPEGERFDLNMGDIAELWRRGSVVTSWLLDLTAEALATNEQLDGFSGAVSDSGEGRWTINAAIEEAVATPVLAASLFARFRSRQGNTYGERILSAMRLGFGGHTEKK